MNRNYRVVYNQSTGTYVAVAEFVTAKKKGGCKSSLKTVASVLMLSGALLGANDAMAAASKGERVMVPSFQFVQILVAIVKRLQRAVQWVLR